MGCEMNDDGAVCLGLPFFLSPSSVDHALASCLGSPSFQLSSNAFSDFYRGVFDSVVAGFPAFSPLAATSFYSFYGLGWAQIGPRKPSLFQAQNRVSKPVP